MKNAAGVLMLMILTLLFPQLAEAQCAMCKAVAETGSEGGSGIADGLNGGILYLMAFPYLLLGAVGYAIYRMKKQQKT